MGTYVFINHTRTSAGDGRGPQPARMLGPRREGETPLVSDHSCRWGSMGAPCNSRAMTTACAHKHPTGARSCVSCHFPQPRVPPPYPHPHNCEAARTCCKAGNRLHCFSKRVPWLLASSPLPSTSQSDPSMSCFLWLARALCADKCGAEVRGVKTASISGCEVKNEDRQQRRAGMGGPLGEGVWISRPFALRRVPLVARCEVMTRWFEIGQRRSLPIGCLADRLASGSVVAPRCADTAVGYNA